MDRRENFWDVKEEKKMFRKILLATDSSDHALRATEKARDIAAVSKDSFVEIVYVVDGNTSKYDAIHHWDALDLDDTRKSMFKQTEKMLADANVLYQLRIVHGEPGHTIVKIANEEEFDLVVIGSRGLNVIQEMVLGSVSHQVAKQANCPVMIVK